MFCNNSVHCDKRVDNGVAVGDEDEKLLEYIGGDDDDAAWIEHHIAMWR